MTNSTKNTRNEVYTTVINILKSNILETEKNIAKNEIDQDSFICYFEPMFLNISCNLNKYEIVGSVTPQTFNLPSAQKICRTIKNGRNESPVKILTSDYFPKYLQYLKEQIEIIEDVANSI